MEHQHSAARAGEVNQANWARWQLAVVALLRADVSGVLGFIEIDEVNWEALRSLYTEGRSPRSAVDWALARDY